ncbi:lysophospholipase L1-like esterase [Gillisia mitskevichiae]|uniref:Lysophospholipase L1-like esterase n=1 Tax=Gillisia mitskevichiae TaxID=270921 RepID=A0A495PV51_9FLAO|nr:SGNH/GDSL hydrolase family protein [Gillisia mitskevichiae]RKS53876.1 lysophospholipase L1-like esterase [Gillisia mitskevichiae]
MRSVLIVLGLLIFMMSCSSSSEALKPEESEVPDSPDNLSYLALGDSYTIGESVSEDVRWPVQLVKKLREKDLKINSPKIIAKTGWTTDNLLNAMDANLGNEKYDLVSVLIGVNNQYQNKSIVDYEGDLNTIFTEAIEQSKNGKEGVFIVSIPDYGATPFGASNAEEIGREIAEFNAILKKVSAQFDLKYYNITPISKMAKSDRSLVANDGLHPSGKMYSLWVDLFVEDIFKKL